MARLKKTSSRSKKIPVRRLAGKKKTKRPVVIFSSIKHRKRGQNLIEGWSVETFLELISGLTGLFLPWVADKLNNFFDLISEIFESFFLNLEKRINKRFKLKIKLARKIKRKHYRKKTSKRFKKRYKKTKRFIRSLKRWYKKHKKLWLKKQKTFSKKSSKFFTALLRLGPLKPFYIIIKSFFQSIYWGDVVFGVALFAVVSLSYLIYVDIFVDLPSPKDLTAIEPRVTTRIVDRNGELLFRIYEDENRTIVPLSEIPQHTINATIAIEDQDFFYHQGFSLRGILRAVVANSSGYSTQGGSTITQQLVKNRLLTPEKTVRRKIRELILAVLVEFNYSKHEILEMYLNQVPYGGSTYGIEEAAQRYFGKRVSELNLAESALLAGLPVAPSVYSPFSSNPELAKLRQEEVLRLMVESGFITSETANQAYQQPLNFKSDVIDIQAPHFVMYVRKLLAEKYSEEALTQSGLIVTTSLDLELQKASQKAVSSELDQLQRLRVNNGAALVTNPQTGEILAMVGSKNYFDFDNDGQVNVTLRPRQPGSSIKPLTYSLAFARGKTPASVIDDSPVTYQIAGSEPYSPVNYDGRFHGQVTLKEALASSYNVPAVKLLAELGVNNLIDYGQELGITTWKDRKRFGLSLTLGGGDVRMIDMAKAYGSFANYGYTVELNPILEVKNYKGEILYRNQCALDHFNCPREKNLDPRIAYQISDILSDNQARTPAFGPQSVLNIPNQQVAVKTGTTNNLRDNWTIGYTTDRLVAVWVGNNDNTPMSYVASGITGASPIWNNITRLLLNEEQPHRFAIPSGLLKVQICAATGTLPCDSCPKVIDAYYVKGTQPQQACNPEWFKSTEPNQASHNSNNSILQGINFNPSSSF